MKRFILFSRTKTSRKRNYVAGWLLLLWVAGNLLTACNDQSSPVSSQNSVEQTPVNPTVIAVAATPDTADPLIAARLQAQQAALKQPLPVLQLTDNLDANQSIAQAVVVQNKQFQQYIYAPNSQIPVRTEIFGIYPWRDSDLTNATSICPQTVCYRVEMYNYAFNLTVTAVVDVKAKTVLEVNSIPSSQPDIPDNLKKLAIDIAVNAPQVQQALGYKPDQSQALMANTKTALNHTNCERSLHLCVAPTFVQGENALWTIVDLTDLTLVGVEWTKVGQSSRLPISEKNLQDQFVTTNFCEHTTPFKRNGWEMNYILTSSDGLRISEVNFNGTPVIANAKLVDWHVSYSRQQGFGYSDAIGCPVFSQAAVVAVGGPQVEPIFQGNSGNSGSEVGFALIQDFRSVEWPAPCNYNYRQRFEFYNDGRFRVEAASIGRGCGNDGTYRPVTRIRLADSQNNFAEWNGTTWNSWPIEKWQLQTSKTAYTPQGYQYRVIDAGGKGYYIEPGQGQFGDGGRGDNAYMYVSRYHANIDEGESDMVTLGACCNSDYQQGPEKFIEPNPEPLTNTGLVLWYVAQLKNDDTPGHSYCWAQSVITNGLLKVNEYPCYSGPLFVPIK